MRPTIHDVASAAGVSPTTVSYVLNNRGHISTATRQRVQAAMVQLGYVRRRRNGGDLALVNPVVPSLTRAIFQAVAETGYALHLVPWSNFDATPTFQARRPIAGALVYGGIWERNTLDELARTYPVVLLGAWLPNTNVDAVWVDNVAGMYRAVDHLSRFGHRRIGLLNGPASSPTSLDKELGFRQAVQGSHPNVSGSCITAEGTEIAEARVKAHALLEAYPDLTAVISGEHSYTQALIDACAERRLRIPADLSVIAYRDSPALSQIRPALTTIALPELRIARSAVQLLARRIDEPEVLGERIMIQPDIIERESVSAPFEPRRFSAAIQS